MGFDIPKATCGGILIALSVLVYALPGCHTDVVLAGTEPQRGERALTTPGSPNVRRRRLGAELRAIRDRRGENLQTVATGLGWSTSKLSRYELGIGLKLREVEILLDHYRVTEVVRENLLGLAEEALRTLPDPVEVNHLEAWAIQHGVSYDIVQSRFGGSP